MLMIKMDLKLCSKICSEICSALFLRKLVLFCNSYILYYYTILYYTILSHFKVGTCSNQYLQLYNVLCMSMSNSNDLKGTDYGY